MDRKDFISSLLPLGAVVSDLTKARTWNKNNPNALAKIPPYLKNGDTIGICCVAGNMSAEEMQPALKKIDEWGFKVILGDTIGKKDFTFGGTDEERINDFQRMLDDEHIKAVLFARGGYGTIRVIDKINFSKFNTLPKWIIGFSDITVLHCHINRNFGIASLHSKMCNSFPDNWDQAEPEQIKSIESIQKSLIGEKMNYLFSPNMKNKTGAATGMLIGGNLQTIESLAGSVSDISTEGKILFLEDTHEYLYSIDRMFWNLERSGKLASLKGLIIGGFDIKKDDEGEEFGKLLEEIVLEKVVGYDFPVCYDFPVGHQKNNVALKCGVIHCLTVNKNECSLTEV